MSNHPSDDDDNNPYAAPIDDSRERTRKSPIERVKGKVMTPAIFLIIVGAIGLIMSILSIIIAAVAPPVPVDPRAPEMMQAFQSGQRGPIAIAVQSVFFVVNVVIMIGAVQMVRFQSRTFAVVASILAIINVGSCCCVLGAPIGIWNLVVLQSKDVIRAFDSVVT